MSQALLLSSLAPIIGARLVGRDVPWSGGASIDTRNLKKGEIFFALSGNFRDGHEFVDLAWRKGCAAVVSKVPANINPRDNSVLVTGGSRTALNKLATYCRDQFQGPIIGVTGSFGKTTVKEMLRHAMHALGYTVTASFGSYNNDFGVPLTLANLPGSTGAVIEIGTNAPGEIARLSRCARPRSVALLAIAPAHLEGFLNLEGVARAKGEILDELPPGAPVVLPADSVFLPYLRRRAQNQKIFSFGQSDEADGQVMNFKALKSGGCQATISIMGRELNLHLRMEGMQSVSNATVALLVLAASLPEADLELAATGIEQVLPLSGRLQPVKTSTGGTIYDDTYNASPETVKQAAYFLARRAGKRIMVMGDMAELGEHTQAMHREVGDQIAGYALDGFYTCGRWAQLASKQVPGAKHCDCLRDLVTVLSAEMDSDTTVLIKASRSSRLERLIGMLLENEGQSREAREGDGERI